MAEYYAVLSKAVASLEGGSPEARRAVYDKARNALIGQLKAIDPPLPTQEISRQRLELEEAIRRVERESTSSASPAVAPARVAAPRPSAPPPAAAASSPPPPVSEQSPPARQTPQDVFRRAIQEAEREAAGSPRLERTSAGARSDASWSNERSPPPAPVPPARPPQQYLPSQGYVEEPPPRADEPRLAPDYDYAWDPNAPPQQTPPSPRVPAAEPYVSENDRSAPGSRVKRGGRRMRPREDADLAAAQGGGRARKSRLPAIIITVLVLAMLGGAGAFAWSQRAMIRDLLAQFDGSSGTSATTTTGSTATTASASTKDGESLLSGSTTTAGAPAADQPPASDVRVVSPGPGAEATDAPMSDTTSVATLPSPVDAPTAAAPSATDADSLVAQAATLYEEPLDAGAAAQGVVAISANVRWSFEPQGPDGPEIVANIDVPERALKLKVSIRRNSDQTLPASHVVEVVVDAPASFPGGGIREIPRVVLKPGEDTRGQPLIGASAKVADGFFWIALSGVDADVLTNEQLLRERPWIDLPLVYENGQRAILTFTKGNPGDRVFERAIAAWAG